MKRRLSLEAFSRQKLLPLEAPARFDLDAANDSQIHALTSHQTSIDVPRKCSTNSIESLIEEIQDEDRQRLLELTSLPKILRGHHRRPRPQTAIIAYAAQRAYERRMSEEAAGRMTGVIVKRFISAHERKLARIARKLRFQEPKRR